MPEYLQSYFDSDRFINLLMTIPEFGIMEDNSQGSQGFKSFPKSRFDTDMVSALENDHEAALGIPDTISVVVPKFEVDDEFDLHSPDSATPSFACSRFHMAWYTGSNDVGVPTFHRDNNQPANIDIYGLKLFHTHGVRTGYSYDRIKVRWYLHGKMQRASGPAHIDFGNAIEHEQGEGVFFSHQSPTITAWWHLNGKIYDADVTDAIIKQSSVRVDYWKCGNVFETEMDQLAFYDVINNG